MRRPNTYPGIGILVDETPGYRYELKYLTPNMTSYEVLTNSSARTKKYTFQIGHAVSLPHTRTPATWDTHPGPLSATCPTQGVEQQRKPRAKPLVETTRAELHRGKEPARRMVPSEPSSQR